MMFPAAEYAAAVRPLPAKGSVISGNVPELFQTLLDPVLERCSGPESVPCPIRFELDPSGDPASDAYELAIGEEVITGTAATERGLFYALQTLLRLCEKGSLPLDTVHAEPTAQVRGIKVYLPEPTEHFINEWKNMMDLSARYHINTVMIELGGALEYKSHPEINEGWLEYAAFMNEYPGKATEIQEQYSWHKNSIHSANGRGKVVSQELMKELIAFCRSRYMEIIPEMPTLSHCDYLMTRHPELSERPEDPYPDTCCPSNPAYYELIFDLFDEVIDLFQPARINIGHDEYYTIGLCEECRKKSAPDIYADDIRKIADHLRAKGVATLLWGEKLLNSHFKNGDPIGGAERVQPNGEKLEATYPAITKIAKDIQILHWYWSIDREFENDYIRHGLKFIYGNFSPSSMPDYANRMKRAGGYIISNWGDADFRTFQRNGLWFDIACGFALSWNPQIDEPDCKKLTEWAVQDLYSMTQFRYPAGKRLTVRHTASANPPYRWFVDGFYVDEKRYLLGDHIFCDDAGTEFRFPVIFGSNISNEEVSVMRSETPDRFCDSFSHARHFVEVTAETIPFTDDAGTTWYQCTYPYPDCKGELRYKGFRSAHAFAGIVRLLNFE